MDSSSERICLLSNGENTSSETQMQSNAGMFTSVVDTVSGTTNEKLLAGTTQKNVTETTFNCVCPTVNSPTVSIQFSTRKQSTSSTTKAHVTRKHFISNLSV